MSGLSLHKSCSVSIQESRQQFGLAEEGLLYSQWRGGYSDASFIDLAAALHSSVLLLLLQEKAPHFSLGWVLRWGECAERAPSRARAIHWERHRHAAATHLGLGVRELPGIGVGGR